MIQNGIANSSASASVSRKSAAGSGATIQSIWTVEHRRRGKLLSVTHDKNLFMDEGLNHILDVTAHGSTQITTWYVAIVESNTAAAAGMTYAVPTYTESTAYTEGARQAYVEAAASGKVMTNDANKAVFSINATKTIYGAALVGGGTGAATSGDTAGGGTLLCYALFSASKPVESGDTLSVTVTMTMASS